MVIGFDVYFFALSMLQSTAAVLVISVVTGDIGSASNLAAGVPTLLLHTGYSRTMETEADDFARDLMTRQGIPLHRFTDMLTRLTADEGDSGVTSYLSTHPVVEDRNRRFLGED